MFDPGSTHLLYNNMVFDNPVFKSFSVVIFIINLLVDNRRVFLFCVSTVVFYRIGNSMFGNDISAIPAPFRKRDYDPAECISIVEESRLNRMV